jgi:hypothetical protein
MSGSKSYVGLTGCLWFDCVIVALFILALLLLAVVLSGCENIDHGNIPIVDLSIPI